MYEGATSILSRFLAFVVSKYWQVLFDRVYDQFVCTHSSHWTVCFHFLTGIWWSASHDVIYALLRRKSSSFNLSLTYIGYLIWLSSENLGLSLINRCDSSVETFTAFPLVNNFSLNRSLAALIALYASMSAHIMFSNSCVRICEISSITSWHVYGMDVAINSFIDWANENMWKLLFNTLYIII